MDHLLLKITSTPFHHENAECSIWVPKMPGHGDRTRQAPRPWVALFSAVTGPWVFHHGPLLWSLMWHTLKTVMEHMAWAQVVVECMPSFGMSPQTHEHASNHIWYEVSCWGGGNKGQALACDVAGIEALPTLPQMPSAPVPREVLLGVPLIHHFLQ